MVLAYSTATTHTIGQVVAYYFVARNFDSLKTAAVEVDVVLCL
jgi:hypothetical protein